MDIWSLLTTSMFAWAVIGGILVFGKKKIMGLKQYSSLAIFGVTMLIGAVVTGALGFGSGATFQATSAPVPVSAGGVGTVSLQSVAVNGAYCDVAANVLDTSNDKLVNIRQTTAQMNDSSACYEGTYNVTIKRSDVTKAGQCIASFDPAQNVEFTSQVTTSDTTNKYRKFTVDSYGKPDVFFDTTDYRNNRVLTFAEGAAYATTGVLINLDMSAHTNSTQYQAKTFTIDFCGTPQQFSVMRN